MLEVVVIGAGYWGTAIAVALRRTTSAVLCLDSAEPEAASPAATGLVRQTTLPQLNHCASWWRGEHSRACQHFLDEGCAQGWMHLGQEEVFSDYRPQRRNRSGLWCADSPRLLQLAHPTRARVEKITPQENHWQVVSSQGIITCRQVVVAAGYFSDALLRASGLRPLGLSPLAGCALVAPTRQPMTVPLTLAYRLAGDTRTRTATARNWPGPAPPLEESEAPKLLRVGSSLEPADRPVRQEQLAILHRLLKIAGGEGPVTVLRGLRPVLPQLFVERVAPGLVVASGGQRSGLASAAGAALRVLQLLFS